MNFYTYQYFVNQTEQTHLLRYIILISLLVILLWGVLKTFNTKNKMKYRDIIILVSLAIVFVVGIQVNDYQVGRANQTNSSQMVNFLDNIGASKNSKPNELAVNSTYLKDEIVVKIEDVYFQINLNQDLSSFKLEETYLMNASDVKLVKE